MVKVLHIIQTLGVGGMENRVARLAGGLHGQGYEISLMTLRPNTGRSITLPTGISVTLFEIPSGIHLGKIWSLAQYIRRQNFTIVHTHNWSTMLYGILAGKLAGRPLLIHGEHGINFEDLNGIGWKRLGTQRILAFLADHIIAVHAAMARSLCANWGVSSQKVTAIPNGVKLSRFKYEVKAPEPTFVIGTVGRLDKVKNFACLIKALSLLQKKYPHERHFKLIFVGDGPFQNSLRQETENLGLQDQVLFVGDVENPESWYPKFSVFVNCSFSEGMSNTILEAMASGLPIIASDIEGNASWLKEGENALLFHSDSAEHLAERLAELRDAPKLGLEMGARNRKRVEAEFDNDNFIKKYRDLYESLLRGK